MIQRKLKRPDRVLDELDYNTQQPDILFGEYGRTVQNMVMHLLTIENKEDRTKFAHAVVACMANLNPQLKDTLDFKHKLWDHLHVMAGLSLDVDSPFPKPSVEKLVAKPENIPYPTRKIKYRYYGKIVEDYLQKISEETENPSKEEYIQLLGSFMKSSCKAWNDENVSDQAIVDQMNELSGYNLNLNYDGQEFSLDMTRSGKSLAPILEDHRKKNKNKKFRKKKR